MRRISVIEPALLFTFVMVYIWELHYSHPLAVLPIVAFLPISHLLHRENARDLGFGRRSLAECLERFAPLLAILALLLLAGGLLLNTTRQIPLDQAFFALAAYLPWGIVQQYLLNGYFLNRFEESLTPRTAAWLTASLFAIAHTPNWFLMGVTLAGGWCATQVYRRHRNLYFLGMAHATIGFLLFVTVPDSVSHHLNVGPGLLHHRMPAQARRTVAGARHDAGRRHGSTPTGLNMLLTMPEPADLL